MQKLKIFENKYLAFSSMFILYIIMIVATQSLVRWIFEFSTQKDLIAFIDVCTFVCFVYLPVITIYPKKRYLLNYQRIIMYATIFIYISLAVFDLYPLVKSDLDYLWTILVLENLVYLIFQELEISKINTGVIR